MTAHARAKLAAWERRHVTRHGVTRNADALDQLRSVVASYLGHFRHAASFRLRERMFRRFGWLARALPRNGQR